MTPAKRTNTRKPQERPISVRLPAELVDRLDEHAALRLLTSDRVSRSDVIKEAIEAYLEGFDDELRARAQEALAATQ